MRQAAATSLQLIAFFVSTSVLPGFVDVLLLFLRGRAFLDSV
jgi:hypothetical protein